jgi:hypothetical protein
VVVGVGEGSGCVRGVCVCVGGGGVARRLRPARTRLAVPQPGPSPSQLPTSHSGAILQGNMYTTSSPSTGWATAMPLAPPLVYLTAPLRALLLPKWAESITWPKRSAGRASRRGGH